MKRSLQTGRLISGIGTLITGIGVLLNGLEVLSVTWFRIIVSIGVLLQAVALVLIFRHRER